MTIGENVMAGFQSGAGSRRISGVGEFIRNKLAEAKQMGLLRFQEQLTGERMMDVERLKSTLEGPKQGGLVTPTGDVTPIVNAEGGTDFPKNFQFITPRESTGTATDEMIDKITAARLQKRFAAETGSPLLEGMGTTAPASAGVATPVSSIITTQPRDTSTVLSPEEQELLQALQALGG